MRECKVSLIQTNTRNSDFSRRVTIYGTDRTPEAVAGADLPFIFGGTEADAVRAVRAASTEGRRPVSAVGTHRGKVRFVPFAGGREEDAFSVGAGDFSSVHTILACPLPGAIVPQFILLRFCRHSPTATPIHISSIVLKV